MGARGRGDSNGRRAGAALTAFVAAMGWVSPCLAAGPEAMAGASKRYEIVAVRLEPSAEVALYRLDRSSGELCAYRFGQDGGVEPRGCAGADSAGGGKRYALQAAQGVRGTTRSSAYRLDRETGEVCRFRLPATSPSPIERMVCTGAAEGPAQGS